MVAAWISADTGVGPSIASGNHVCKPNCADLPVAAITNNKPITPKFHEEIYGLHEKIVSKFTLRKVIYVITIANTNA